MRTKFSMNLIKAAALSMAVLAIVLGAVTVRSKSGESGHFVGNGGDHVRATFIKVGLVVLDMLESTDAGQEIVSKHNLDIEQLRSTLTIDVIEVQDAILVDNSGSVVDALGVPGKIILSKERFVSHFEQDRDVYFLVFHEMLRAAGVNDDNYVVSASLNPFPQARKILTRISTIYPLLGVISLDQIIPVDKILIDGTGCPKSLAGTFADFDLESNVLNIALQRFDISLITTTAGRKACSLVIPINPPLGHKVVISQMDFSAKVIGSNGTKVAIASRASFGNAAIAPQSKSLELLSPTQGRLLIRSHQEVSSNCNGTPELLKITTAGSIQRRDLTSARIEQLIGDRIGISFSVESCSER